MAEVGRAYLTVMPSAKGFASSLSGQVGPTFVAAGRTGGQSMGDEAGRTGKQSFAAAGMKLAGAFAAAFAVIGGSQIVQGITSYISDAIGSASGLEQSIGGVDAVFKDSADTIHGWAEAAADSVGLARSEYNELATVLGAQLKNMGVPLDEVAIKTGDLVAMGADLAAQFGGTTSDAVSALSSLLRGERDPIERYGISINEAAVKAKAMSMGLVQASQDSAKVEAAQIRATLAQDKYNAAVRKYGEESPQALAAQASMISANASLEKSLEGTGGELDANAKMQATLALLTEQSADAHGAFARESGTLAGQQQRLKAEMENVKTEIGTALMPVVTDLLGVFRDEGIPVLQGMASWFTENKDQVYSLGVAIAEGTLGILDAFLAMGEGVLNLDVLMRTSMLAMSTAFFAGARAILTAADLAFGWIPGVGDKLDGLKGSLETAEATADVALRSLRDDAVETRDSFSAGRDAVDSLRDAVSALDGKSATVYLNARGDAMSFYQSSPGLTPHLVPGRATGGPVTAGRPYIVGEKEAELFVPAQSGHIYNQAQLARMGASLGGTGVQLTQNIHPVPGMSESQVGDMAARRVAAAMTGVPR